MSTRLVHWFRGSSALLLLTTFSATASEPVNLGCAAAQSCRAPTSQGPLATTTVNPVPACSSFGTADVERICKVAAPSATELACRRDLQSRGYCQPDTVLDSRVPRWNASGESTFVTMPAENVSRAPRPRASSTSGRGFRFAGSERGGFRSSALGPVLDLMSAAPPASVSGPLLFQDITTPRGLAATGSGAEDVVLSCSEYVYKRFYEYEQLVMAARARLPEWGAAWEALGRLQTGGSTMLGYASPSSKSLSTALSAPLAGSAVEGANTLLMPIQPNDVAIRSLQRNAMFATLPAGVAARLGTSATTVGQALAAGASPLWVRDARDVSDPIFAEWVAHASAGRYLADTYGPELASDQAKAYFTGRAARYGEKLVAEVEMQQELFCVEHSGFSGCSRGVSDLVNELARRYAHRNDAPGPIPELFGSLDDPRFGLDPLRSRARVHELSVVGRVLSDPEMRAAPLGAATTRAQFLALADRVRARIFSSAPAVAAAAVTVSAPTSLSLSLAARTSTLLTAPKVPTLAPVAPLAYAKLNASSLATLTSAQAGQLANISVADARTLDRTVLMSLPTDTLERLARDSVLAAVIAAQVNLAEIAARRDALVRGIADLDTALASMLLQEWSSDDRHGCLEVRPSVQGASLMPQAAPNRCDWSPEIALRRMMNLFVGAEEDEFRKCVKATGDSFDAGGRMMFDPAFRVSGRFDTTAFLDSLKWTTIRLPGGGRRSSLASAAKPSRPPTPTSRPSSGCFARTSSTRSSA